MTASPPLLDLQNGLSTVAGISLLINRFSIRIERGEHVSILGPNVSGKSNLIKTLTRECYPLNESDMSISILGRSVWNIFELGLFLGIVSRDLLAACTTDASCPDVVLSGFFSSTRICPNHTSEKCQSCPGPNGNRATGRSTAGANVFWRGKAHADCARLGSRSANLLVDEPGNALDIAGQVELRQSMLARAGIGLLLVTHHSSEIVPEIGRVVLLKKGMVLADGPKRKISQQRTSIPTIRVFQDDGYYHLHARTTQPLSEDPQ